MMRRQARSQLVFFGKSEGLFCVSCTFIFRNERNSRMKKSARVSKKNGKPGLTWLTGSNAPGTGRVQRLAFVCSKTEMTDILKRCKSDLEYQQ